MEFQNVLLMCHFILEQYMKSLFYVPLSRYLNWGGGHSAIAEKLYNAAPGAAL